MKKNNYLARDKLSSTYSEARTVDEEEIKRFSSLADEWWAPEGSFSMIHKLNPIRESYVRRSITEHFSIQKKSLHAFAGLRVLDVGCGVGFLCEYLAQMGATVTGVDAVSEHIEIARQHAKNSNLSINYRHCLAEHVLADGQSFDVVLNTEVIEHVADQEQLMKDCVGLLNANGLLVVATLNRTIRAFLIAILGAEYILGWLPKGTHSWERFVRPEEITAMISPYGLRTREVMGVVYNPVNRKWGLSENSSVNYMLKASR